MKGARSYAIAIVCTLLAACVRQVPPAGSVDVQIIPRPHTAETGSGVFLLQASTTIVTPDTADDRWIGAWLAEQLQRTAQLDIRVGEGGAAQDSDVIVFEMRRLPESASREAYNLSVTAERIVVTANDSAGLFYGAVSVWQLATAAARVERAIAIPAVTIEDSPRFAWRGLMLDVARHYVSPQFIRRMIDWMALHKLNTLHWHLTDDQGWRLEIEAFPRLTEVGAWRTPAGPVAAQDIDPATGKPRRYGGYYTKNEVRDIVAYAAKRHITIIPEIDMPGHAQAAIAAYPEFGVDDVQTEVSPDWGIHNYLFNVEESTFTAIETILAEVLELFPGQYIHVGGDEAVKDRWTASDRVQQRMDELGVADETALQSYFIRRVERFLQVHGRKLIGWDEILEGGIAPQATVMSWRGIDGAIEAASLGHDAVLSPWPTLYFDHRQSALAGEPPGRGLIVSVEDVYRFDPLPAVLANAGEQHVLGVQANIWSEHIRTEERLAYMTFPRAAALAEMAWTSPERMDWENFVGRLAMQFDRYRLLDMPFSTSVYDVQAIATTSYPAKGVDIALSNQSGMGDIRYTVDGSDVTADSTRYSTQLDLPPAAELSAATFVGGKAVSATLRGNVGEMARRRFSHELDLCTGKLVLSLEDDAPATDRRTFLVDIMNPCWRWNQADLSDVTGIKAAVGQVPFNFQLGADRDRIELSPPDSPDGELEVRAGGCDGDPVAILSLREAARSNAVTVLSGELSRQLPGKTDLCFRFTADRLDPLWVIDRIELTTAEFP